MSVEYMELAPLGSLALPIGDDVLFGDEFLQLLNSDLGMEDTSLALPPFEGVAVPAEASPCSDASDHSTNPALVAPASPQSSSGATEQQPILLRNMAVSRGPKSMKGRASATGLPLLCRTVTTDLQHPAVTTSSKPEPVMLAASAPPLSSKHSGDGSEVRPRARKCAKRPASEDMDDDTDSDDSNDTDAEMQAEMAPKCGSKRKAPEIDWRSITDPAERRRQRRLAKNRITAARSRERKKSQWATMEAQQQQLEAENRALREALEAATQDNQALRAQLEAALGGSLFTAGATGSASGAAAAPRLAKGYSVTEPAVLVLIATLLTVCAVTLPAEQVAAVLGTVAASLALLNALPSTRSSSKSWSGEPGDFEVVKPTIKTEPGVEQQLNTASMHWSQQKPTSSGAAVCSLSSPHQGASAHIWALTALMIEKSRSIPKGLPRIRVPTGLFI